jgi:CRISPR-associated exonuclease Cas4
MPTFREVAVAAYCPRKLYYRRRADEEALGPPPEVRRIRALADRYPELLASDEALAAAPIEPTPTQYRSRLGATKARLDAWDALCDPLDRDVLVAGEETRGLIHKLLLGPSLSLIFAGDPPDTGVWHPQTVRLVAAARALAADREADVERVYAEYPAHGLVRAVDLDRRRRGAYREALRTARTVDGPPARTDSRTKCQPCEFADRCGVRTRSLLSRLAGEG